MHDTNVFEPIIALVLIEEATIADVIMQGRMPESSFSSFAWSTLVRDDSRL
jgi:hypothetical protein